MVEDTAANVRPIIRETSRLPQSYSIAVGAKRKKCTSTAGRVSRSATAFISAFSAKFGLHVILLSAVRYDPASSDRRSQNWSLSLAFSLFVLGCLPENARKGRSAN